MSDHEEDQPPPSPPAGNVKLSAFWLQAPAFDSTRRSVHSLSKMLWGNLTSTVTWLLPCRMSLWGWSLTWRRRHQLQHPTETSRKSPHPLSSADRLSEGEEIVPDVCFGQQEAVGPHGGDPGDLTLHFSLAAAQRDSRSAGECGSQEYEGTGDPGRRALSSPQQPWTGRKWISSPPSVRSGNQRGPALEAATVVGAGYTLSVVQPGAAVQPMRLRLP